MDFSQLDSSTIGCYLIKGLFLLLGGAILIQLFFTLLKAFSLGFFVEASWIVYVCVLEAIRVFSIFFGNLFSECSPIFLTIALYSGIIGWSIFAIKLTMAWVRGGFTFFSNPEIWAIALPVLATTIFTNAIANQISATVASEFRPLFNCLCS